MTQAVTEERVEAVIISGPRKGEFISVVNGEVEPQLSPAEEAMLDFVVEQAKRVAERMVATTAAADSLLEKLREVNNKHELSELPGGSRQDSIDNGFATNASAREVEPQLSPAAEAMLNTVVANEQRLAENIRDTRLEAEALLNDLREANKRHAHIATL